MPSEFEAVELPGIDVAEFEREARAGVGRLVELSSALRADLDRVERIGDKRGRTTVARATVDSCILAARLANPEFELSEQLDVRDIGANYELPIEVFRALLLLKCAATVRYLRDRAPDVLGYVAE